MAGSEHDLVARVLNAWGLVNKATREVVQIHWKMDSALAEQTDTEEVVPVAVVWHDTEE